MIHLTAALPFGAQILLLSSTSDLPMPRYRFNQRVRTERNNTGRIFGMEYVSAEVAALQGFDDRGWIYSVHLDPDNPSYYATVVEYVAESRIELLDIAPETATVAGELRCPDCCQEQKTLRADLHRLIEKHTLPELLDRLSDLAHNQFDLDQDSDFWTQQLDERWTCLTLLLEKATEQALEIVTLKQQYDQALWR